MSSFSPILLSMEPISLAEMDAVALLNRMDVKYILREEVMLKVLEEIKHEYRVLEVEGNRESPYQTLYYDTPDFLFYRRHQNGKLNRLKIRKRRYAQNNLTFLEVKFKTNKSRTVKQRTKIPGIQENIESEAVDFVHSRTGIDMEFVPKLWNEFNRTTLVNKTRPERITIDTNLRFDNKSNSASLAGLVILEVKQDRLGGKSPVALALKKHHVYPESISKYCVGVALLYDEVRKNMIKEKLRKIRKLQYATAQ